MDSRLRGNDMGKNQCLSVFIRGSLFLLFLLFLLLLITDN